MTQMNFDLEDGLPPVSFVVKPQDAERITAFMAECTKAIKQMESISAEKKAVGEIHDKNTMFLNVFVGTAKNDDQEYELSHGMTHAPIVRNLSTHKYFTIGWPDVIQLAIEAGIDEMDGSNHG